MRPFLDYMSEKYLFRYQRRIFDWAKASLTFNPMQNNWVEWKWLQMDKCIAAFKRASCLSLHAPHGVGFFMRDSTCNKGNSTFRNRPQPQQWFPMEGPGKSFTVDSMDSTANSSPFICSVLVQAPFGFRHLPDWNEKKVDIAFLGWLPPTMLNLNGDLITVLDPGKVVIIHWEGFFRNVQQEPAKCEATNSTNFFED